MPAPALPPEHAYGALRRLRGPKRTGSLESPVRCVYAFGPTERDLDAMARHGLHVRYLHTLRQGALVNPFDRVEHRVDRVAPRILRTNGEGIGLAVARMVPDGHIVDALHR